MVLAAGTWLTNGELIADVARLGYLRASDLIVDPTFGRGLWWTDWRPGAGVVGHDIRRDGVDFRHLPHEDGKFDALAFDPPYVCQGGRSTTTVGDFYDRYGLTDAPRTPLALQQMIHAGMAEADRVVRPGGVVLVKCKDYVSSGRVWWATHKVMDCALDDLGWECCERFEHVGRPGPQSQTSQVHARRNLSTLFVFRTGRARG